MKQLMQKLLPRLSGDARFQHLLERNVAISQYLLGIGSGSSVDSSGEGVLVKELRQLYVKTGQPICAFDVGANKGQFLSLLLNGLQGIPLCVHAFEPAQHTYAILSDNAERYSNIHLNNFGLGQARGEFDLFYDEIGSGMASLSKRRLDHFGFDFCFSEKVRIETLDDYCKDRDIQDIDLLKIDVEGHELEVLQGGVQMLRNKRIKMISFEFGGCNIDTRTYFQDFWYFFKGNGLHRIFRIAPSGSLITIQEYREEYEQFRTTNFLVLQG